MPYISKEDFLKERSYYSPNKPKILSRKGKEMKVNDVIIEINSTVCDPEKQTLGSAVEKVRNSIIKKIDTFLTSPMFFGFWRRLKILLLDGLEGIRGLNKFTTDIKQLKESLNKDIPIFYDEESLKNSVDKVKIYLNDSSHNLPSQIKIPVTLPEGTPVWGINSHGYTDFDLISVFQAEISKVETTKRYWADEDDFYVHNVYKLKILNVHSFEYEPPSLENVNFYYQKFKFNSNDTLDGGYSNYLCFLSKEAALEKFNQMVAKQRFEHYKMRKLLTEASSNVDLKITNLIKHGLFDYVATSIIEADYFEKHSKILFISSKLYKEIIIKSARWVAETRPELTEDQIKLNIVRWLLLPRSEFENLSPKDLMIDGRGNEVRNFLEKQMISH